MNELTMLGEKSIWGLSKTAFLSSDKFSAGSVLKSYDWAAEVKRIGHITAGRLLIVSPFESAIKRPRRGLAFERNQFIVDSADEIVFAHIHSGGMLERLTIGDGKAVNDLK